MIGSILSIRYELTHELGDSPIFTAYAARDRVSGRDVTIRLFKPPFNTQREMADRIREVIGKYSGRLHPGVEALIEIDEDDGNVYLVSETSKGISMTERIKKLAPFSVPVSVSTGISVLEALHSLHSANLVHGDISASNIVSMPDGQARLQLAGVWEAYSASPSAGAMVLPSMAPYLAPEVSAGSMLSPASDVYSVGVLLYELLTGRLPYNADTAVAMALKHATAGIPSVKMYNPSVPVVLDEIIKKALAKDPAERYSSAGQMLSDMRILQDALRFGKVLTWPLKKEEAARTQQPVAPKMSAIRDEEEIEEKKRKKEKERDVPVWMLVSLAFFGAIAVALIGVWVVFNMNKPRLVTVPNIVGSKVAEAKQTLDSMNLNIKVVGRDSSERYPPDTILQVSPDPGQKVHENAFVTVRVSSGSRFVEVPDLRGATLDSARSMLESLNLELDNRIDEVRDRSVEKGLVVSQIPGPREKVQRFTRVRATISAGNESPNAARSNDDRQYLYTLNIKLSRISEDVTLRVDITDARGTRTVHEQRQSPEDEVVVNAQGYGTEAIFRIFYDGEMVKQVTKVANEGDRAD